MIREYDIPTYNQLEAMLMEYGECCLIGIPGVGKTRISMHFAEKHNLNALVITPRTEINNRWQYWGSKTDRGSISTITIQNFYTAYAMFVDEIDLYIFDECHCLGAKKWGKSYDKFKDLIDTNKCYILGLSATPNRYFDEGYAVNNIGETVFNNHIVYCMGREEAISLGLISRSKYVCALYDVGELKREYSKKSMTEELRGRLDYAFKNQPQIRDILIKHAPQNYPKKGIVYVDKIDSIDDGINIIRMTFPEEKIWSVHSKMSKSKCSQICKEFEESESGFIVNVDILSEGVHYEGINMIIMLRKTSSPTKFTQQSGRASNTEESIIFDFVANNVSVDNTLDRIEISKNEFVGLGNGAARESAISNQEIVADYVSDFLSILQDIDGYNNNTWTPEEIETLKKYYPIEGPDVYKRLPGRTRAACKSRAVYYNIKCFIGSNWTFEEDEIIKKYYPYEGSTVYKRLPNRTKGACSGRAKILGIRYDNNTWTPEEIETLKKYYPIEGPDVYKRLPGRTRSACTIRARELGIWYIRRWTPDEDDILKKYYPIEGPDVYKRLPGRTIAMCKHRSRHLGVKFQKRYWTPEEIETLKKYYSIEGPDVYKRLPGRTRSACNAMATKMRLKPSVNYWKDEEIYILKKFYHKEGPDVYKRLPGRDRHSCRSKASTLGLCSKSLSRWTPDEDDILKKYYPIEGPDVYKRLPGRTRVACKGRAMELNVAGSKNLWTPDEDDILKKYYPIEGPDVYKRLPGRTRAACQRRFQMIK